MELWVKKKHKKHASVVESNMLAWLYQLNAHKIFTSFTEKDQKVVLETKWNGDIPLNPKEVETQAIMHMEINWLVESDNISLRMTGLDLIKVEDDYSISFFVQNKQIFIQQRS